MVHLKITGKYNSATIYAKTIDEISLQQIYEILNNSAYIGNNTIKIMPDVHAGKGSVVGFTMKFEDRLDPRCVGVDIGCGVSMIELSDEISKMTYDFINKTIINNTPWGSNVHDNNFVSKYKKDYLSQFKQFNPIYTEEYINNLCKKVGMNINRFWTSIGSLGGGNHYIEINKSNINNKLYLTVHSGSRNFGIKVCNYYVDKMVNNKISYEDLKKRIEEIKKTYSGEMIAIKINEAKLNDNTHVTNYISDEILKNYLEDMQFAQFYAQLNRHTMISNILYELNREFISAKSNIVNTIHNYIDIKNKIIRKGSVSAQKDEMLVIPLNMRDGVILARGKGNIEWNYSAPHGAGRIYSRSKAKDNITLDEFKESMSNVYSTSVCDSTIDESPMAYKNMNDIIECIQDTVDIIEILKPVINIKATS